jgi:catechol O-methyltransferase
MGPEKLTHLPTILLSGWIGSVSLALLCGCETLQKFLLVLSVLFPILFVVLSYIPLARSIFWTINVFTRWITPTFFEAVDHILKNSEKGNPKSIVNAFDYYCWNKAKLMNVGDVKGEIVDQALLACKPKVAVELGSHCGYSTIRFASLLEPGAIWHSVDPDALGHSVSAKLVEHAGLAKIVNPWYGFSGDVLKELAKRGVVIDFLFVDHVKDLYLEDLKLALSLNLLRPGSVVVADNVLFPGAPDYKEWILKQPFFESTIHSTFVEYSKTIKDEVLVSKYLGQDK